MMMDDVERMVDLSLRRNPLRIERLVVARVTGEEDMLFRFYADLSYELVFDASCKSFQP